jgi:FkbM family methyltransferase
MRRFLDARPPSGLTVKFRDKFFPAFRLAVGISEGVLPYDKNDIVATHVARGTFEVGETNAFLRVIPHVGVMIDVGANLGFYTLLGSRRISAGGRVIAFEASSVEFEKLQWTVTKNRLKNVTAVHAAVSDAMGTTSIYESLSGSGALNRIDQAAKPTGIWRESVVPMTTLDAWDSSNGPNRVDLLKIDVEGHEMPVLLGAAELLKRDRPAIMIEMNPRRASARSDPSQVWELLLRWGYRWFRINDNTGGVSTCETFGETVNLFAIHRESPNPNLLQSIVASKESSRN